MSKYILNIGCHRGTLTSRDSEVRKFDTENEAMQSYQKSRKFYHSIGYQVWFATITLPDGKKIALESNPYR